MGGKNDEELGEAELRMEEEKTDKKKMGVTERERKRCLGKGCSHYPHCLMQRAPTHHRLLPAAHTLVPAGGV